MEAKLSSRISLIYPTLLLSAVLISGSCKKEETKVPTVVTYPVTQITASGATGTGLVTDDGGSSVTHRGVCWNTSPLPAITDGNAQSGSGLGPFTATLTGLTPNTRYYVRNYATNEAGTGYSDQLIFQTMNGTVTDVDGNVYPTVKIGSQVWMAGNLNVTHYATGISIPNITDYFQWGQYPSGAGCFYANDYNSFGKYYGILYNWYAVSDPRGLCPEGWHIPVIEEWDTLFTQLGGADFAGGKLKSALTGLFEHPFWIPPNYYGTNESSFSAFPGGFRSYKEGIFSGLGYGGYWWSSTPDTLDIKGVWLSTNSGKAFYELINKNSGASVRCIKN